MTQIERMVSRQDRLRGMCVSCLVVVLIDYVLKTLHFTVNNPLHIYCRANCFPVDYEGMRVTVLSFNFSWELFLIEILLFIIATSRRF